MRPELPILIACLFCSAGGTAVSEPVSARDVRGHTITLAQPPKRIVSLAPAVTEILFSIGVGDRVVGVTSYCDYPPAARAIPKIGDFRASAEKVLSRRPDLVIASASANAQSIPQLERLRVPVFVIDTRTVEEVLKSIRGIGEITGSKDGAVRVISGMRGEMDSITHIVSRAKSKPQTLIVVDVNGPWIAGRSTYMDDLVRLAGGVNIGAEAGTGWIKYSPERALIRKPDVLLVADRHPERLKTLPGWSRIPAVAQNRVYGGLPVAFVRPGPRLPQALKEIARLLHPEQFQSAGR